MNHLNIAKNLLTFQNDFLYFQKKIDIFRKDYPDKFVAVHDKKFLGADSSMENLKKELAKKGIDISGIVVEFISKKEITMIL